MTLQHLRSSTANKRPDPTAMADGQLAINTPAVSPGLFFKDAAGVLVKVGPVHVGTTAPNASPASGGTAGNSVGEQWLDTTGGTYVFKVWDGSAWRSESGTFVDVSGDTMTGALGIIAGSAGSPGLYFTGDTNTGIYSPGADQVAVSTGGTVRLTTTTTGITSALPVDVPLGAVGTPSITFTGDLNTGIYSPGADQIAITTGGTGRLFIDSSGRLLAGTSTARTNFFGTTLSSLTQIEGTGGSTARGSLSVLNNDVSNNPPYVLLGRSGAATLGSNAAVVSGSRLGTLTFHGADGTSFIEAATVAGEADGTPGANDMPGRLVFSTTADGAASPTERLRITSAGLVGVGTSSPSYTLDVTGSARITSASPLWLGTTTGDSYIQYGANATTSNNWTVGSQADGSFRFFNGTYSSGTERLRITSAGNVGVGTTSPISKLHVSNSGAEGFEFTPGSATNTNLTTHYNRNGSFVYVANQVSAASHQFFIGASEAARIDSSGRVGIGTSTPVDRLHVDGRIAVSTDSSTPTTGEAFFYKSATGAVMSGFGATIETGGAGSRQARVSVDSSGRVGIGTTSVQGNLHSYATGATYCLNLDNTNAAGDQNYIAFSSAANLALVGKLFRPTTTNNLQLDANYGALSFGTGSAGTATERARIDNSGRLLVGTSTARANMFNSTLSSVFQVEGTTHDTSSVSIVRNSNDSSTAAFVLGKTRSTTAGGSTLVANNDTIAYLTFQGADGSQLVECASIGAYIDGTPGADDMPGRLVFATTPDSGTTPVERMRIGNGGLTSIGGVYTFTTGNAANVNVDSSGYLQRSTSSIKYKTDVETLDDQYADALLACRPVWYRSTCEHDCSEHSYWGFIAEEVASIDPRLVHWKTTEITHDENGVVVSTPCTPEPEGVQYERFVPHLLNLIKRQKEQIEAMEVRLTALETA